MHHNYRRFDWGSFRAFLVLGLNGTFCGFDTMIHGACAEGSIKTRLSDVLDALSRLASDLACFFARIVLDDVWRFGSERRCDIRQPEPGIRQVVNSVVSAC